MTKKKTSKKASSGFEDFDAAKEAKEKLTSELNEKRKEFKQFLKDTGLKKGKDYSKDKQHGKQWSKLNSETEALEEQRREAFQYMKDNKPKKSSGPRATKYNYPDEVMNDENPAEAKKKFRAKSRAAAKRAGVDVDTYLSDPDKYDKQAKENTKSEKKEKAASKKKDSGKSEKKAKKEKSDKKPSLKKKKKKKSKED